MEGSSVNTQVATKAETRQRARRSSRALAVLAIGPTAALVGLAWAVAQPYRITMLDPTGQGFWWLLAQPRTAAPVFTPRALHGLSFESRPPPLPA